ncbi:hypothetical protein D3C72_1568050 [compost metagenome]
MQDVDAGAFLEQFAGQVRRGAGAERGEGQLARILLGISHDVLGAVERPLGAGQQDQRAHAHHADARETVRIVRQFLIEVAVGDQRRVRGHQDRVAIRRFARHERGADGRARAGLVLDDHGLAQVLGHALGQDARQHIRGAARREGRDHLDRPGRKGVGLGTQRGGAEHQGGEQFEAGANHVFPLKSHGREWIAGPGLAGVRCVSPRRLARSPWMI